MSILYVQMTVYDFMLRWFCYKTLKVIVSRILQNVHVWVVITVKWFTDSSDEAHVRSLYSKYNECNKTKQKKQMISYMTWWHHGEEWIDSNDTAVVMVTVKKRN